MCRKQGIIKIQLKSDLCIGSGYAYEGSVDNDICYNEHGIPFIPARRLKGCLREAAELIQMSAIEEIFGTAGQSEYSDLIIDNGYIENAEAISEEIVRIKNARSELAEDLTQQRVLEEFTTVKAQTAILEETGVAKENSLRFLRVINQYAPYGKKEELIFFAQVEFGCEEYTIRKIVKALRHMGLNRNRGLGNVECELCDVKDVTYTKYECKSNESQIVELHYVLKNIEPLMLSGKNINQTERYISGTSILGAIAKAYLSQPNASAQDEWFQEMFHRNRVQFSNATITVPEKCDENQCYYEPYYPAPLFLNKLKKTKKLVNISGNKKGNEGGEYVLEGGNQPKKLKTEYVHFVSENQVKILEVNMERIYHHSQKQKSINGEEGILYVLEAISEGQYFTGTIVGERKYIEWIAAILDTMTLRFGKSKAAQYGKCKLMKKYIVDAKGCLEYKKGDTLLISFLSDGVFLDACGYITRYTEIKKLLAEELKIEYDDTLGAEDSYLQTKLISGYNMLWNLKKPSIEAVGAGSVIAYTLKKDCMIDSLQVGERKIEGFGQIMVQRQSDMHYAIEKIASEYQSGELAQTLPLLECILFTELRESWVEKALDYGKIVTNPTTLGRVTLMLIESVNEYSHDMEKAFEYFINRVESIKDKEKKKQIILFLEKCICMVETNVQSNPNEKQKKWVLDMNQLITLHQNKILAYKKMEHLEIESLEDKVKEAWPEYLMNILIYQKYLLKD